MDPTVAPPPTTTTTTTTTDDDSPNNPTTIIIKRKRTKRQRPTFVPQSSTSYNALNSSPATFSDSLATSSYSPATSSDSPATSTTTEDEDTANCLILLSKGHNNNNNIITHRNNNNKSNNHNIIVTGEKFNSKRYIQTSTDDGLYGVYVYDCKTCGRTFSSFQALGGHRASHKKPKLVNEKAPPCTAVSDDDEHPSRRNYSSSSSSISLQLHHRNSSPATIKKHLTSKLHDCSICGAEFTSGQALGGHMRRHRPITTVAVAGDVATDTTLSLVPYTPVTTVDDGDDGGDEDDQRLMMNDGLCLDLDLNLPAQRGITVTAAVAADDRRSFKFTGDNIQKKQQSTVHLSGAPTLVDCHY